MRTGEHAAAVMSSHAETEGERDRLIQRMGREVTRERDVKKKLVGGIMVLRVKICRSFVCGIWVKFNMKSKLKLFIFLKY